MKTIITAFCILLLAISSRGQAPVITSFTPTSGNTGTAITILGSNFIGTTSVSFGNSPAASFTVDSATGITAVTVAGAAGFVKITTALGTDSLDGFNVPTVQSFTPLLGNAETVVTIKGTNFSSATVVRFGGSLAASFLIVSDTIITAITGKVSSGSVEVTNAYGTAGIPGFTYNGPPVITSFSPDSGIINSVITITGTGFNHLTLTNNIVYFNTVRGTVTAATPTTLTVTVPAGAGYQPFTVTSNLQTAYSNAPFYITFPNNGIPLNNSSFTKHSLQPISYSFFAVADFNADNKADIVSSNSVDGIFAYRNNSTINLLRFVNQTANASGTFTPSGIVSGNFDGDPLPEIVITSLSNNVWVFKNSSPTNAITFTFPISLISQNSPRSPVVADFNGDGKSDLALVNYASNSVSVFKNTCSNCYYPSFGPRMDIPSGTNPASVAAADVDGDQLPDIIVANEGSATISVYRNISTLHSINFAASINLPSLNAPGKVAISDLDKDGKPDLLVSANAFISVFKNNSTPGNISFSVKTDYPAGISIKGISAGDIDGDAMPDIIVTKAHDTLSILKNISTTGNILFATKKDFIASTIYSDHSVICDLNGDGKAEIIGQNYIFRNKIDIGPAITTVAPVIVITTDTIRITGNNFTGATAVTIGGVGVTSFTVISDSVIQAIAGPATSGALIVTTPYGNSSFAGITVATIPVINSFSPSSGPVGSLVTINGDGFSSQAAENIVYIGGIRAVVNTASTNIISAVVPAGAAFLPINVTIPGRKLTVNSTLPFIVTYPGAGISLTNSSFAAPLNFTCDTLSKYIVSGDFDLNGKPDLMISKVYYTTPALNIIAGYYNSSTPGVIKFGQIINQSSSLAMNYLQAGDLNADGKTDVINGGGDINILTVNYNNSTGTPALLSPVFQITRSSIGGETIFSPDLDMDGRNDIIQRVGNFFSTRFIRNTSNFQGPSFGALNSLSEMSQYWGLSDFDGDGKMDYIGSILMRVLRNTSTPGNISFATPKALQSTSTQVNALDLADFDGDGKPDIIFTNLSENKFNIIRNTSNPGNISGMPAVDFPFINPGLFKLSDMDGDGMIDIVMAKAGSDSVAIIKNLGTPGQINFAAAVYYKTGGIPISMLITDIDVDGRLDIVTINNKYPCCGSGKTFSVLRNRISEPQLGTLCPGGSISFTSNVTGATYQWQIDTGTGYIDMVDNINYSGSNTATLQISNAPSSWYGYKYRCVVNAINSYEFSLVFTNSWTGTVNNDWENPDNWSCGSVPDSNTDVIITSGTLQVNASTTIRSLAISPGVTLTVVSGVTFTILH